MKEHVDTTLYWRQVSECLDAIDRNWSWLARTAKISRASIYRWRNAERRNGWPPRDVRMAIAWVMEGAGADFYESVGPIERPPRTRRKP